MRVCVLKNADFVTDAFHNLPLCVTEVLRGAFGPVWRALCSLGWGELPGLCYVLLSSMAVKSLERSRSESKAEHFSRQSTFFFSIFFFFSGCACKYETDYAARKRPSPALSTAPRGRAPTCPSVCPRGPQEPCSTQRQQDRGTQGPTCFSQHCQ